VLRIEEMATCLWASLSAPSFTLLKRLQEGDSCQLPPLLC